jgi:hypothetical protein
MTTSHSEPEFWGVKGNTELLVFESVDELLDDFVNNADVIPESVEVEGFVRDVVPPGFGCGLVIEHLIEMLDDRFGMDDCSTVPTEAMKGLEAQFIAAVVRLYKPYAMHLVERKTVDLRAWVQANAC